MTTFRVRVAAELLGVSPDTVHRRIADHRIAASRDGCDRWVIDGKALAAFACAQSGPAAGNRLPGIVTAVVRDGVMARVDVQAGPFRLVSVISRGAADDLDLQVGSVAVASFGAAAVGVRVTSAQDRGRNRS